MFIIITSGKPSNILTNKLCSLSRKMYTLTVFWKDAAIYLFITKLFGLDDDKRFLCRAFLALIHTYDRDHLCGEAVLPQNMDCH